MKTLVLSLLLVGAAGCGGGPNLDKATLVGKLKIQLDDPWFIYGPGKNVYVRVQDGFETLDFGDGTMPAITSSYGKSVGGQDQTLSVHGPALYYRDGIAKVHVFSLADPANPVELGVVAQAPFGDFIDSFEYRAENSTVVITDFTDPIHPKMVGSIATASVPGVRTSGSTLYVSDGAALSIYETSDRAHPKMISRVSAPQTGVAVTFPFGYVWLQTVGGQFQTVDVDPPTEAHLVGSPIAPLPGYGYSLSRTSRDLRYWFMADVHPDYRKSITYDLADPSSPSVVSSATMNSDDNHTTEMDDRFLYTTTPDGIWIYKL